MRKCSILVILCACLAASALANTNIDKAPAIATSHAWIRLLPAHLPLAGYIHITNNTDHSVTLSRVTSAAFKSIHMHQSTASGAMKRVKNLTIAAHSTLRFSPGGYHLMMMRAKPLSVGEHVAVTLHFANTDNVTVRFVAKKVTQ